MCRAYRYVAITATEISRTDHWYDQYLSNDAIYEHNCFENIKNYTNKLVSVKTSNNSKIFLRMIWFLLLKYSPTTILYLP